MPSRFHFHFHRPNEAFLPSPPLSTMERGETLADYPLLALNPSCDGGKSRMCSRFHHPIEVSLLFPPLVPAVNLSIPSSSRM
mgnify:CR=1 FL=1